MVYVPSSKSQNPSGRRRQTGASVQSMDRLSFVLDLVGANVDEGLETAEEMGLTGDDLEFIEDEDVENLLSVRLQRRKLLAVCEYLQNGGNLWQGMTMADVYNGGRAASTIDSPRVPKKEVSTSNNHNRESTNISSDDDGAQETNISNDWMQEVSNLMNKLSGKFRQLQALEKQFGNMMSQFTGCFKG